MGKGLGIGVALLRVLRDFVVNILAQINGNVACLKIQIGKILKLTVHIKFIIRCYLSAYNTKNTQALG